MPNEYLGKLLARTLVHAVTFVCGLWISRANPYVNIYLALAISFLGGLVARFLEKHLFGTPPFGSRLQRALVGSIPGMVTGITVSVIHHWKHEIKFFGAASLPDWLVWASGFAALFAVITAFVPERVWLRYWLTDGRGIILELEPSDSALRKLASMLHDTQPSARVGAAQFFFWRARQGRPAPLALDDLVSSLLHDTKIVRDPNRRVSLMDTDGMRRMIDEQGFPQNASIAIAATIGAKLLHIPWEHTDLDDFRLACHEILGQDEDEQVKADARLYLSTLFKESRVS